MSLVLRHLRLPLAHFTLEVDLELRARVTGIFGPSGSGKTSLLEAISGLRRPAAGSISFAGVALTDVAQRIHVRPQHRGIGYVPQEGALFPHLLVKQNLLYGYRPDAARPAALTFDHVTAVLEITHLIERPVGALSGGEKQRVALGRALLAAPRLLLLDEPLAGLDAELKDRVMPYLQRVRDEFKIPMLCVTHSADEVMTLCEELVVLALGRVTRQGPPGELLTPVATPRYQLKP